MTILAFADDPGGANGIIALAAIYDNMIIHADGASLSYIPDHDIPISKNDCVDAKAVLVGATRDPNSKSYEYIKLARSRNIPSFAYVDGSMNAEKRFCGTTHDPLCHAPDYLIVTDQTTYDEFEKLGFNKQNIFIIGNPRYDFVIKRFENKIKKNNNKPEILFLTDPLTPTIGPEYGQSGFKAENEDSVRSYLLLDDILSFEGIEDCNLTIKLHPRNTPEEFIKYHDYCSIYQGNALGMDLAFDADLAIGTTTALLMESTIIGTPTIAALLAKREEKWIPQKHPNTLNIVRNTEELHYAMRHILSQLSKKHRLPTANIETVQDGADV